MDSDSDQEQRRTVYPIFSVFDIGQTDPVEGVEEVPDYAPRLKGGDDAGIFNATAVWLTDQGWTVTRETLGEDGATSVDGTRRVRIHDDLSDAHAAVTILHRAGHATLHTDVTDYHQHRSICETKSVA